MQSPLSVGSEEGTSSQNSQAVISFLELTGSGGPFDGFIFLTEGNVGSLLGRKGLGWGRAGKDWLTSMCGVEGGVICCQLAFTAANERSNQKSPEFYVLSPLEVEEKLDLRSGPAPAFLGLTLLSKSVFVISRVWRGGHTLKMCAQCGETALSAATCECGTVCS